ncbi:GNAT family N-acetyltransferase [Agromyces sp. ZXT2-6]|uniref:GNAT family N-acetyltransferase n=1 Tax=Agromyces sp. ZXT2-6 TaxID=3461153 RepID=UPI004054A0AA
MPDASPLSPTLAERIGPVAAPTLPAHPDVASWRPATPADVDALLEYFADVAREDHPHWTESRDEIAELFELPHIDPARDTLTAIDRDGRVIAHGTAICPPGRETMVRSIVAGAVRPSARGRGVGRLLLDWQLARAREQLAESGERLPGWIMAYVEDGVTDAAALLESRGLQVARHFSTLQRDLGAAVPHIEAPPGVRVVPWSAEWSESARHARNAAFADHWGSQSTDAESWRTMAAGSWFAADLSFLATAPDAGTGEGVRVVAFAIALRNEEDWPGQGFTSSYVRLVGVVREHRGRGLAKVLLARHLEAAGSAGLDRSTLDVDAENPTGALALYAGLGYEVAHRHSSHVLHY